MTRVASGFGRIAKQGDGFFRAPHACALGVSKGQNAVRWVAPSSVMKWSLWVLAKRKDFQSMIQLTMKFREVMTITFVFLSLSASVFTVTAAESKPLIRDVQTGYLLNCSFRAIRPYAWKKPPLLTGWETDGAGGTWESNPDGLMGEGQFTFHINWFRLRDTSNEHPVTIKHQIARQKTRARSNYHY